MGMISSFEGYLALPMGVLEDCRAVMAAAQLKQTREARQNVNRR